MGFSLNPFLHVTEILGTCHDNAAFLSGDKAFTDSKCLFMAEFFLGMSQAAMCSESPTAHQHYKEFPGFLPLPFNPESKEEDSLEEPDS